MAANNISPSTCSPSWQRSLNCLCLVSQGDLESVYRAALALGTANQLTNILRDVGEDINERNRIYVPTEDFEMFNIEEKEVRTNTAKTCIHRLCCTFKL